MAASVPPQTTSVGNCKQLPVDELEMFKKLIGEAKFGWPPGLKTLIVWAIVTTLFALTMYYVLQNTEETSISSTPSASVDVTPVEGSSVPASSASVSSVPVSSTPDTQTQTQTSTSIRENILLEGLLLYFAVILPLCLWFYAWQMFKYASNDYKQSFPEAHWPNGWIWGIAACVIVGGSFVCLFLLQKTRSWVWPTATGTLTLFISIVFGYLMQQVIKYGLTADQKYIEKFKCAHNQITEDLKHAQQLNEAQLQRSLEFKRASRTTSKPSVYELARVSMHPGVAPTLTEVSRSRSSNQSSGQPSGQPLNASHLTELMKLVQNPVANPVQNPVKP